MLKDILDRLKHWMMRQRASRYVSLSPQQSSTYSTLSTKPVPLVKGKGIGSIVMVDRLSVKPWDVTHVSALPLSLVASKRGLPEDDAERKALPIFTFITEYFPDAVLELVRVSVAGNNQHNPGQPLHWARDKSTDQMNTSFRHQWDHKMGVTRDKDGQYHLAKAAWRLLAELQLTIEKERANEQAK